MGWASLLLLQAPSAGVTIDIATLPEGIVMHKVTVDDAVLARLGPLHEHVELCDASGRTVGFFVVPGLHPQLVYGWLRSQVTDEELEASRRREGGRTWAEILAYLHKIEAEEAPAGNGTLVARRA